MRLPFRILPPLLVPLLLAASAIADSDGYFCAGDGYLAHELQFSRGTRKHTLFVHALGREGIESPRRFEIPGFQVHGMRCAADSVELLGWDAIYRVKLNGAPGIGKTALRKAGDSPAGFLQRNLGDWSFAGKRQEIPLPAPGAGSEYVLVIEHDLAVAPGSRAENHHVKTQIVQARSKRRLGALTVYERKFVREMGD